ALVAADQIDAIYVSFEDGFHRVVSRLDADRRRSDPRIPAEASWHASYIDAFSAGPRRARHRRYFGTWPQPAGEGYSVPTDLEIRTLNHYVTAKRTRRLAVDEPTINPDTGYPVMSLGWPVTHQGRFIGFVGANM